MRVFSSVFISLIILFTGVAAYAQSDTGYVTDRLVLTFRQGPGPSYPVLKTLESDAPLTILDQEGDYLKVRLSSGDTGWVDKQFVIFDLPKTMIIETLEQEKADLEKQLQELSAENDRLKDQMAHINEKSKDVIEIIENNDRLENENKALARNLALLENESGQLFKTGMIKWFLAGFGVLFLGWFLGQSVSGKNRRRRSLLD
jgi:SH3 domain protein